MVLGTLRLGMRLDLDDQSVVSQYHITNIRTGVSDSGRVFRQFSFGPGIFDSEDRHISEGIEVNGFVDSLIKAWVLPYRTETEMQKVFHLSSSLFGELYYKHLEEVSKRTTCILTYSQGLEAAIKVYPDNMAMAVQLAILSCVQSGNRVMARLIFFEDNDLNTSYTLELLPSELKFQLSEFITIRD